MRFSLENFSIKNSIDVMNDIIRRTMENTKEYICRALVTFVDHLGSVSANLEDQLLNIKQVQDTEARVNCLQQVGNLV